MIRDLIEHLHSLKAEERRKTACRNMAKGAAIGTLVGLIVGVLFAPKSGKETRQLIADKSVDTAEAVKETVSGYVEELMVKVEMLEKKIRQHGQPECASEDTVS
ncbi:MAG: YtxH domain-containing protein [Peptococcaceae bacterium]|nr:YtxH domain-containing protein [Peptococcaceae bacterium]